MARTFGDQRERERGAAPAAIDMLYEVAVDTYGANPYGRTPWGEQVHPTGVKRSWERGELVSQAEVEAAGYEFAFALWNGSLAPAPERTAMARMEADQARGALREERDATQ